MRRGWYARRLGAFTFLVKVLLREPHFVSTHRPPNVAGHAALQELASVVYLGEGPLAFMAIAGGVFVGHF
jgi:hypothetical protein